MSSMKRFGRDTSRRHDASRLSSLGGCRFKRSRVWLARHLEPGRYCLKQKMQEQGEFA